MTEQILSPILIPVFAAGLILILRVFPGFIALIASAITLITGAVIYSAGESVAVYPWLPFGIDFSLKAYDFSSLFVVLSSFFAVLIILFSTKLINEKPKNYRCRYYSYFLVNLGFINGAFLANNLLVLLFFWEATLIMLYALVSTGEKPGTPAAARKAFITVGIGDFCLMLGVLLFWQLTGGLYFTKIKPDSALSVAAFVFFALGALSKAGAMPFHNWIPDASTNSPVTVMAYLPASLDKLLGIYLLTRIFIDLFTPTAGMGVFLMSIGAFTILAAVFMAMLQHNAMRLLSYHAISQVGYMVLGIGTGNPAGIVGGVFHMLNNTIYKTGLFLCSGSVEKKSGTAEIDKLGGYGKTMPVTFLSFLIAALAISGIPPLNGFFSKWMVYQGVIDSGFVSKTWWLFLVAAMFGSALTLASFMKLVHSMFLGQSEPDKEKSGEVGISMWLPGAILATLCLILGIFAVQLPLQKFLVPALGAEMQIPFNAGELFTGLWRPMAATGFIIAGILLGLIIYLLGKVHPRTTETYIGGEKLAGDMYVSGVDFYQTIREVPVLKTVYNYALAGAIDFYEWFAGIVKTVSEVLFVSVDRFIDKISDGIKKVSLNTGEFVRQLHGGLLSVYLFWSLLGFVVILLVLMR
ncbi:MAG: proton-conducting transporter membrane subunit [Elusimicrobiota bacterium]